MWEHKCTNQLDLTLNGLYSARSLVQSLCYGWLSPCVKESGNCPLGGLMMFLRRQRNTNVRGISPTKLSAKEISIRIYGEIWEFRSVRADAKIVKQIQRTAKDSAVYDQITNRLQHAFCIMSCLLHAVPRHQPSLKPNGECVWHGQSPDVWKGNTDHCTMH